MDPLGERERKEERVYYGVAPDNLSEGFSVRRNIPLSDALLPPQDANRLHAWAMTQRGFDLRSGTFTVRDVDNNQMSIGVMNDNSLGITIEDDHGNFIGLDATWLKRGSVLPQNLYPNTGESWEMQTWSPSYTGISVGDGVVTAVYLQTGARVDFNYHLDVGTTTTIGNGFTISLPNTAHARYANRFVNLGNATAHDSGSAVYTGWAMTDQSQTALTVRWNDGTAPSNTTFPFAEANGDDLDIQGWYYADIG